MSAAPVLGEDQNIGEGYFGKVYKYTWNGQQVAVKKIMKIDFSPREEKAMKSLEHRNVLKLFHVGEDDQFKFLYLELCEGTIGDYCQGKYLGPMPEPDNKALNQMADGLFYIHNQGFVHRDIKGENVLIYKTTTGTIQLKISDFGLSKPTSASGKYSLSGVRGTPIFLAPELLQLEEEHPDKITEKMTTSSDIFALGCLFHIFLTKGKHPFDKGSGIHYILPNIIEGNYNLDSITNELYQIVIEGMICSDPGERTNLQAVLQLTSKYLFHNKVNKTEQAQCASVLGEVKKIDEGSFGSVYKYTWNGQQVAVKKIMKIDFSPREEKAMKSLEHRNVLKLFHVGEDDRFKYLYLELCEASIKDYCQGKYSGPMPEPDNEALNQMTAGLFYIHNQEIIHRDIKGENVLIYKTTTGKILLKISDFGLSKPTSASGKYSLSGVRGTPIFLPPELIPLAGVYPDKITEKMTISSDIFALGCLFHIYLTKGKHPFDNGSGKHLIQDNIVKGKYNLRSITNELYQIVIEGMICSDPKERTNLRVVLQLTS